MNQYTSMKQSELYQDFLNRGSYLIKVGTNVLTGRTNFIDQLKIDDVVNQAALLYKKGKKIIIVTSGARQAGLEDIEGLDISESIPSDQALAAIGQPHLMDYYRQRLKKHGLRRGQIMMEYDHTLSPKRENLQNTVEMLYKAGAIPIINENDPAATDEIEPEYGNGDSNGNGKRIGDNDVLSAKAAHIFGSDVIFMLSEKNGFLQNGNGSKFNVIDIIGPLWEHVFDEQKSDITKGGMRSKLRAIQEATSNGIYVALLPGLEENVVLRALKGEPLGTLFLPANYKNQL